MPENISADEAISEHKAATVNYNPDTGEVYVMNDNEKFHVYFIQRELSPEQAVHVINRDNGHA